MTPGEGAKDDRRAHQAEALGSLDRSSLDKQPNSRYCFVCGLENRCGLHLAFYETEAGEVVSEFVIPDRYQGYPGVAHGGVLASILDELAGRAIMVGKEHHFSVTAKLEIRYRKPVPVNEPLRLRGRVLDKHGRLARAHAEIRLPDGSLGAEAEATLVDWPQASPGEDELEALGWRVYPDEEAETE
jgi:acyl-coenzyme A thioesterase PaaI-like protein